jgi:hypothetical protein
VALEQGAGLAENIEDFGLVGTHAGKDSQARWDLKHNSRKAKSSPGGLRSLGSGLS